MDKEPAGLGISWLWKLPNTHPFYYASVLHDIRYDQKEYPTSYEADQEFLVNCLNVATTPLLKAQAYLFYFLCRAWGKFRW
jgi:hypothetical protein